jgi:hypothetical protein
VDGLFCFGEHAQHFAARRDSTGHAAFYHRGFGLVGLFAQIG